jgi:hypothetical protein
VEGKGGYRYTNVWWAPPWKSILFIENVLPFIPQTRVESLLGILWVHIA